MKSFKKGETVRIEINEEFELHLPVLASAGYEWQVSQPCPGVELVGNSFRAGASTGVGGESRQSLKFRGVKVGTHRLRLAAKRAWDATAAETAEVEAIVTGK